jgi:hypothetical protein
MTSRSLVVAGVTAFACLLPLGAGAQGAAKSKPAATTKAAASPKTPWGDADLQGIWTNTTTTPLERLPEASEKAVLTEAERETLSRQVAARLDQDKPPAQAGAVVPYNEFWYERGVLTNQTSLIIDPPDGRLPALTAEGQKRMAAVQGVRKSGAADSWLDRSAYDRCITRGMPGAMMPGFYNHNYQILQAPGYVAIVVEMIHDARIIPLDNRPHLPSDIRQWLGDSRGHFEGNTLVVETTNLTDKIFERGAATGFGDKVKMVEKFTRVGADRIDYQFTIEDPTTFTKPWTASTPMAKIQGPLYEYACHEGNYAMSGILGGARADEKAAADAAKTPAK